MNTNKLSFGLFMFHGKSWGRNLKDIPIFIKRIFFVLKHGYSPVAQWEIYGWFMSVMKELLINHRNNRWGTPVIIDSGNEDENIEAYNKILDNMIDLLDKMDESNPIYNNMNWKEEDEARENAKNEFFKLFSEYFYCLWD